jgi:hypothetical protein
VLPERASFDKVARGLARENHAQDARATGPVLTSGVRFSPLFCQINDDAVSPYCFETARVARPRR